MVEQGYIFPFLKDWDHSVARADDAACTPGLCLFDEARFMRTRLLAAGVKVLDHHPVPELMPDARL